MEGGGTWDSDRERRLVRSWRWATPRSVMPPPHSSSDSSSFSFLLRPQRAPRPPHRRPLPASTRPQRQHTTNPVPISE